MGGGGGGGRLYFVGTSSEDAGLFEGWILL